MDVQQIRAQATGWLAASLGPAHLAREAERAERGGCPEIAAQLREWEAIAGPIPGLRFEAIDTAGETLYRCTSTCGHVGSSITELYAHHDECHEAGR